jgi:hypothetical protein
MKNYSKTSNQSSSGGPHRDYEANFQEAKVFCINVRKNFPPEKPNQIKASIGDSHGIKNAMLWISWMPPMHAKKGNYANPIFLHQSHGDYNREVEKVFNRYVRMVKEFEDKSKAADQMVANL